MPGKVNPVIPEVVNQVAFFVVGLDATVTMAAEGGQLQLNAFEPVIAMSLLDGIRLLAAAATTLEERCIRGLAANEEVCRRRLDDSTAFVTALVPLIGYETAVALAKAALASGTPMRDLLASTRRVPQDVVEKALAVDTVTGRA
jgi:aspartate ammonia-lyase